MKNHKLILADYITETSESIVTIATDKGNFTGKAKLAKADEDIESSYFGCELAESKAYIKYVKKLKAEAQVSYRTLYKLNTTLSQCKDTNMKSREWRKVRRAMYEYRDLVKYYSNVIKEIENSINDKVKKRAAMLRKGDSK